MIHQEKQQSTLEAMGQMYAVSFLPFVGVTIGALLEGWKFTEAATAGLWAGPGFISVLVIAYVVSKAVRSVWSDIISTLPGTVQQMLGWTAGLLAVAVLAFAIAAVAGSNGG
ncbi:hypothetical protein [Bradyrhizobium uaiense]|uniref:Uncharacterized protein n=1 Tax=Bradyrhizobium uaiense TaxID=2594946 RepID=A0A6P1BS61_9BRAD|nr:hypothetical protein [Bradyrhizobium uaiense]NEV01358.1 hypothetical protein [Bradyrhizobium uaiense]